MYKREPLLFHWNNKVLFPRHELNCAATLHHERQHEMWYLLVSLVGSGLCAVQPARFLPSLPPTATSG
jgi:hypothetical protein